MELAANRLCSAELLLNVCHITCRLGLGVEDALLRSFFSISRGLLANLQLGLHRGHRKSRPLDLGLERAQLRLGGRELRR